MTLAGKSWTGGIGGRRLNRRGPYFTLFDARTAMMLEVGFRLGWIVCAAACASISCGPEECRRSDPEPVVSIRRTSQPQQEAFPAFGLSPCMVIDYTPEWLFQCDNGAFEFPLSFEVELEPSIALAAQPGETVMLAYGDSWGWTSGYTLEIRSMTDELLLLATARETFDWYRSPDMGDSLSDFVFRPAPLECGMDSELCGDFTSVGLEIASSETTVAVYDGQWLDTDRWRYVMANATVFEKLECTDVPMSYYVLLIAAQ